MKFLYSYYTDRGGRQVNQDSLLVKNMNYRGSHLLLMAVCDGMGGMSEGEVASRMSAELLSGWFDTELPQILDTPEAENILRYRFGELLKDINRSVCYRNAQYGVKGGTTLTALLLWDYRYLIGHVGDSRVYRISQYLEQMTRDDSLVAREVEKGNLSAEEALHDERQNIVLQCIGIKEEIKPQILMGRIRCESTFLLCTDGFWHCMKEEDCLRYLKPERIRSEGFLQESLYIMAEQAKQAGETDNISAVTAYIY